MKITTDYHVHTFLCGHATGKPEEYVLQAIKSGLKEIGISDHAPLVSHRDPTIAMPHSKLPLYHKIIDGLILKYGRKITIRRGIEADFVEGYEAKTKKVLDKFSYDFITGSVHFIEDWGFDNPIQRYKWDEVDVNRVYKAYFKLLRRAARSNMFDIMAHVDLVKKFGDRPTKDMTKEVEKTAEVFKKTGATIELNTSGLYKKAREMYPSLGSLKIYCSFGVPMVFGSDSHSPEQVGRGFEEAASLARKAGYKKYAIFSRRKIIGFNKI
ncbi:MAG: histidinol-phosphatase HisJ family protein [Candidatus Omnitrophica bacterium]|nr:histidinol-phosphatase HisJ family protein [Candidatus Omnitrophota bacterium]